MAGITTNSNCTKRATSLPTLAGECAATRSTNSANLANREALGDLPAPIPKGQGERRVEPTVRSFG